jgi:ATP-dependent Clp protease ATP-binding subunit ClpA
MYERFTDRARKVMQLANQEAQRFNHEYIGTEHILLGLIAEGSGVAANVLHNLDVDMRRARQEVERIVTPGPAGEQVTMSRLPHTPRTKKVIQLAIEETSALNHNYVGTEHLLLGLLREQEGVAAQVLIHLGAGLDRVRAEVLALLGVSSPRTNEVYHVPEKLGDPEATATFRPVELPQPLTPEELQAVRSRIRLLTEEAARLRTEADALTKLLVWHERYKDTP